MNLYTTLEKHFNSLDNVIIDEDIIFESDSKKEFYESHIMFAFRKFSSLDYHISNVNNLIKQENDSLLKKTLDLPGLKTEKTSKFMMMMKIKKESYEYIYELSAFLGAMKSCLDLLSEVSSSYLKGVKVNYSITPLLKLSAKKNSNILTFIKKNEKWIRLITEYRHPLLHRLMLKSNSGYEIHRIGEKTSKILYPVLIPTNTPQYIADTRKQRMFDASQDSIKNTLRYEQIGSITKDIIEEIIDYKINYEASEGYIKIEDFMKQHKNNCEKYFIKIIDLLDGLDFKYDICT